MKVVEASLLGPADDMDHRMSPTWEEEAVLLGDELEPLEAPEATLCPYEHPGAPNPKNQPSSLKLHAHLPHQPQHLPPVVTNLGIPEEPGTGLSPGIWQL